MTMQSDPFDNALAAEVWRRKYRYAPRGEHGEASVRDSWRRVAAAVASVEGTRSAEFAAQFLAMLEAFAFLPAGRIMASAGTAYDATLFNCFVMGTIDDSIPGIFERLRESAVTMQQGGGIGCDFSTLRPQGSSAAATGRTASGPVSFMHLWNAMCRTLLSGGNRRGAMMGVLRCDHPDIEAFIDAKRTPGALTNFNLSVLVSDAFMRAVAEDDEWPLVFADEPATAASQHAAVAGVPRPLHGAVRAEVPARSLWRHILDSAYDTAEPGVLFVDRINALNNLYYRESISATNPCGEVPLPPNGACNLGSINLAAHVANPFGRNATIDLDAIGAIARRATRFLDDVIDLSRFPLPSQSTEAHTTRRIGLGVTGLADALIMLGHRYDSDAGRALASQVVTRIRDEAYAASVEIAREKGSFPAFDRAAYLDGQYIRTLPDSIRDAIAAHGIRNSHLLAVAPAGSISILANNVSSGIEPVFAAKAKRVVRNAAGIEVEHDVEDYACSVWARSAGAQGLPPAYVGAHEVAPEAHLLMAARLQPLVDNSISKTVNVAETISRDDFAGIYRLAYDLGLKGCTVFRRNSVRGAVLSGESSPEKIHCCVPEREGD